MTGEDPAARLAAIGHNDKVPGCRLCEAVAIARSQMERAEKAEADLKARPSHRACNEELADSERARAGFEKALGNCMKERDAARAEADALRAENRHWMRHGRYIPDCGDCEDLRKLRERADKLLGNYLSEQKLLAETITRAEKAEAEAARWKHLKEGIEVGAVRAIGERDAARADLANAEWIAANAIKGARGDLQKAEADLARLREALQLLEDCANPGKNGVCDACHDVAKAALAGDGKGGVTATGVPAKPSAPAKPAKAEPCSNTVHCMACPDYHRWGDHCPACPSRKGA